MWLNLDWFQRSLNCHQTKIDRNSPMCSLHSALRFVGFVVQNASIRGRINIHFLPGLVPELRKLSPDKNWSKLTYVQPTFCTEVRWFRRPKRMESSIRGRINHPPSSFLPLDDRSEILCIHSYRDAVKLGSTAWTVEVDPNIHSTFKNELLLKARTMCYGLRGATKKAR